MCYRQIPIYAIRMKIMTNQIYTIRSQQKSIHPKLIQMVKKNDLNAYLRPISVHAQTAFFKLEKKIARDKQAIIIDSCCGTGKSTQVLGAKFPNHLVVGIDRSRKRLEKIPNMLKNTLYLQCNCEDIWRLILTKKWSVDYHYILYPNPYPKIGDLKKRWHGHPVFPSLLKLAKKTIVRSDWRLYLDEFALAAQILNYKAEAVKAVEAQTALTAFEIKYRQANRPFYELIVTRKASL